VKPDTFYKYVQDDPDKRRKLGQHAGRPSLLSKFNSQFVMEHIIRAEHANNGLTPAQIIENMSTLQPELSKLQSKKSLSPHVPQEACQQVEAKASQGSTNYIEAKPVYCCPAIPMVHIVRKGSLLPMNEEHRSV
jgi:hypothetical protein